MEKILTLLTIPFTNFWTASAKSVIEAPITTLKWVERMTYLLKTRRKSKELIWSLIAKFKHSGLMLRQNKITRTKLAEKIIKPR